MRHLVIVIVLVAAAVNAAAAQVPGDRFSVGLRVQSHLYTGERSTVSGSTLGRLYHYSGRGLGLDVAYRVWRQWEALFQFEQGRVPEATATRLRWPAIVASSSTSTRSRYSLGARRSFGPFDLGLPLVPPFTLYASGGVSVVSGRINGDLKIGAGPSFGAGMSIPLPIRGVSGFADLTQVYVFPNDALDLAGKGTFSSDWLFNMALGVRYRFRTPPPTLRVVLVTMPSMLDAGQSGWFTATVEGDEETIEVEWVFSDGSRESGSSVRHTFRSPGTYDVTVTARKGADAMSRSGSVTVSAPASPVDVSAVVASPLRPRVGEPVMFRPVIRGSEYACAWEFGDGESASGCDIGHVYTASGLFSWRLTVSAEGNTVSVLRDIRVETDRCVAVGRLRPVYFHPNSTELIPEMRDLLRENMDLITSCPGRRIHLVGTATPDEQDAPRLANQRALAVFQYYRLMGIPSDRFDDRLESAVVQPENTAWQSREVRTELQ